ncbi:unnamed protein product, partial [Porites evermanni]
TALLLFAGFSWRQSLFRVACKGCDYNWAGEVISLLNMSSPVTHSLHTASVSFFYAFFVAHGSYNLEKVLNFTSRREKSLESVEDRFDVVGKTRNIAIQLLQDKLHAFCCQFYRTFRKLTAEKYSDFEDHYPLNLHLPNTNSSLLPALRRYVHAGTYTFTYTKHLCSDKATLLHFACTAFAKKKLNDRGLHLILH